MKNLPLYLVMFVSRKKDNLNVRNFEPRKEIYVTHEPKDASSIGYRFKSFVEMGKPNEISRFYYSVNQRDSVKTQVCLQHLLLDQLVDLVNFNQKIASIAARPENALTHHWLLDIDTDDEKVLNDIKIYLEDHQKFNAYQDFNTRNGFGIILDHGFDIRELLDMYPQIDLKRDDMCYVTSMQNYQ